MVRIAIVIGSTRPGRKGEEVARWAHSLASERSNAVFELIDIADFDLPLLDEPEPAAMNSDYAHPHTISWSETIAGFDGFVFVVPEYNHSVPAAWKNAIDFLYDEWKDKAAAFVGYGTQGGQRAVEHARNVMTELHVANVRDQVALSMFDDVDDDGSLDPREFHVGILDRMLDQLVAWSTALSTMRVSTPNAEAPHTEIGRRERPSLSSGGANLAEAETAVRQFVGELQTGIDEHDADTYNRHFATDVAWGSPHGATVYGYDDIHAIHAELQSSDGDPLDGAWSRYEIVHVAAPAPGVAIAHVRRNTLDEDGSPIPTSKSTPDSFSEMALYVLVRRDGDWWLAAGHNTIIERAVVDDER